MYESLLYYNTSYWPLCYQLVKNYSLTSILPPQQTIILKPWLQFSPSVSHRNVTGMTRSQSEITYDSRGL